MKQYLRFNRFLGAALASAMLVAAQLSSGIAGAQAVYAAKPNNNGNAYGVTKHQGTEANRSSDSEQTKAAGNEKPNNNVPQPRANNSSAGWAAPKQPQSSNGSGGQSQAAKPQAQHMTLAQSGPRTTTEQSVSRRKDNPLHKVTICHRTNSNVNPYVRITIDTDAAHGGKDHGAGDHAAKHQGPVWNPDLKTQGVKWGDIIPSYTDDQGVGFAGLNWTASGQAIYNSDCKPVGGSGGGCVVNCNPGNVAPTSPTGGNGGSGQVLGAITSMPAGAANSSATLADTGTAVAAALAMGIVLSAVTVALSRITKNRYA